MHEIACYQQKKKNMPSIFAISPLPYVSVRGVLSGSSHPRGMRICPFLNRQLETFLEKEEKQLVVEYVPARPFPTAAASSRGLRNVTCLYLYPHIVSLFVPFLFCLNICPPGLFKHMHGTKLFEQKGPRRRNPPLSKDGGTGARAYRV